MSKFWLGALMALVVSGGLAAAGEGPLGRNELAAVAACKMYAEAQEIYLRTDYNGDGVKEYAQHIGGGNGKYGLYTDGAGGATEGNLSLVDASMAQAELAATDKPAEDKDLPEPTPAEREQFKALVAKLGSDSFQDREEGRKNLAAMGGGSIKLLEETLKETQDVETRTRCKELALAARTALGKKLGLKGLNAKPRMGYIFKIMTAQGADAPGGAKSYIVNGRLVNGYAVVAFPAEYGKTGKYTFMINNTGQVYAADLGAETRKLGEAMQAYNPDKNWKIAE
jgi:hypothetical protein